MEGLLAVGIIVVAIVALVFLKKLMNYMYFSNELCRTSFDSMISLVDLIPFIGGLMRLILTPSESARKKYELKHPESKNDK